MRALVDGLTLVLIALNLGLCIWVARFVVGPPRRMPCPQCKGTGAVGKENTLTKTRCPFCGGTREVWR